MAEHGLPLKSEKVLGVALDGLGYGMDGTLWGGEFLLVDYQGFERVAKFQPLPMLGGVQAIHEPWRNTLVHLMVALDWSWVTETYANLELVHFLNGKPLHVFQTMLDKGINSPLTSSAGRLFDAVAAAVGVCRESVGFEGQAAIELEALATVHFSQQAGSAYGFNFCDNCLNWKPLWLALLQDLAEGVSPGIIAARFHHAIANAVSTIVSNMGHRS